MNNLIVKTQAAMNMKELGLAPSIALERSGLSNDPLSDIAISKDYIEQKWSSSTPEVQLNGTEDEKKDDETETKTEEKTVVVESEDKTDEQND